MRVAIVDDEPLARSGILAHLARHRDVTVVGEYADGRTALDGLRATPADLLFLDIQMPALDGIGMLAELPRTQRPLVIFVTAHDNFAIRAFELRAVDYLLKPIDDHRLREALDRARDMHTLRRRDDKEIPAEAREPATTRFAVRIGRRIAFIDAAEVEWIEASGDYATLHVREREYLLRDSLAELAKQLDPAHFVRVHRSTIVRLDRIAELQSLSNRDALLRLHDGTPLRVSRTYIATLLDRLGKGRYNR